MEEYFDVALQFIEKSGWLAPVFFVLLHVLRQLLFIPVIIICLVGGYLFGTVHGSFYSVIGLTLTSVFFYGIVHAFPRVENKLSRLKERVFKQRKELMTIQLIIIRFMPFIHFHLVSLYVKETTTNFTSYLKKSFLLSIPPAIVYTAFGDMLHELPLAGSLILTVFLLCILALLGRKKERTAHIRWTDFFQPKNL